MFTFITKMLNKRKTKWLKLIIQAEDIRKDWGEETMEEVYRETFLDSNDLSKAYGDYWCHYKRHKAIQYTSSESFSEAFSEK